MDLDSDSDERSRANAMDVLEIRSPDDQHVQGNPVSRTDRQDNFAVRPIPDTDLHHRLHHSHHSRSHSPPSISSSLLPLSSSSSSSPSPPAPSSATRQSAPAVPATPASSSTMLGTNNISLHDIDHQSHGVHRDGQVSLNIVADSNNNSTTTTTITTTTGNQSEGAKESKNQDHRATSLNLRSERSEDLGRQVNMTSGVGNNSNSSALNGSELALGHSGRRLTINAARDRDGENNLAPDGTILNTHMAHSVELRSHPVGTVGDDRTPHPASLSGESVSNPHAPLLTTSTTSTAALSRSRSVIPPASTAAGESVRLGNISDVRSMDRDGDYGDRAVERERHRRRDVDRGKSDTEDDFAGGDRHAGGRVLMQSHQHYQQVQQHHRRRQASSLSPTSVAAAEEQLRIQQLSRSQILLSPQDSANSGHSSHRQHHRVHSDTDMKW